jgi:hypothetical protein
MPKQHDVKSPHNQLILIAGSFTPSTGSAALHVSGGLGTRNDGRLATGSFKIVTTSAYPYVVARGVEFSPSGSTDGLKQANYGVQAQFIGNANAGSEHTIVLTRASGTLAQLGQPVDVDGTVHDRVNWWVLVSALASRQ